MTPSIQYDASYVAPWLETRTTEQALHLRDNLFFELQIRGRVQLLPTQCPLSLDGNPRFKKRHVECQESRLVWIERRDPTSDEHGSTYICKKSEALKPSSGRDSECI